MKFLIYMINKNNIQKFCIPLFDIWVYLLMCFTILPVFNLNGQTLGDIRACFDLEIQDTLVWIIDYNNKNKSPFNRNSKHYEHLAFLIFERKDTIFLEKWYTIENSDGYQKIIGMHSIPDTAWKYPENKFNPIPPGTEEFISDSMIVIFNSFRDSILDLSEKTPMSNDWKRFLKKSILVSTAALFCSYPLSRYQSGQQILLDYYGRQIINTLTILRYLDCLEKEIYSDCILSSILILPKFRQYKSIYPLSITSNNIYADPIYLSEFYNTILKYIPLYIQKYPDFREFLNAQYFKLFSGLSHYNFDQESALIKSFIIH